jgi:hypothetical protein
LFVKLNLQFKNCCEKHSLIIKMKRGADKQITKDDDDESGEVEAGIFEKASSDEIANRRFVLIVLNMTFRIFKRSSKKGSKTPQSATSVENPFATVPSRQSPITFNFNNSTSVTKTDSERILELGSDIGHLKAQMAVVYKKLDITDAEETTSTTEGFKFITTATTNNKSETSSENKADIGGFIFGQQSETEKPASFGFSFGGGSFSSQGENMFSEFSQGQSASFSQGGEEEGEDGAPAWANSDYTPEPVKEAPPSVTLLHSGEEKVESGEEDETTLFSQKVKLFELQKNDSGTEWKERGIGTIKLNEKKDKSSARLVMRKEHVFTILLNAVIFAEMKCQTPQEKSLVVSAFSEKAVPQSYLIKFQKPEQCKDLKDKIDAIKVRLGGKTE